MTELDLIILTVYLICVAYVFYQAIQSFEDQVVVRMDRELLNAQLQEKELQDQLDIQVKLKPVYQFEQIQDLLISIRNNFPATPVYADWDYSALSNFGGRSRRVIRLTATMRMDLSQPQIFSVIAPQSTLTERVTAEDVLKPNIDSTLQISAPLVDLEAARSLPENKQLEFWLRLVLRMVDPTQTSDRMMTHALSCRFIVQRVPWSHSLPWYRPKKK